MNTGINPGFRTVVNGNEDTLMRQVVQFEGNTAAAFDAIAQEAWPKLVPTNVKSAAYTATEDDLVPCAGTFQLMLPVASPQNQGRAIGVELQSGTLTVVPTKGLVQGGASDVLTAVGDYLYISDGVGWYRHASSPLATSTTPGLVALTNDLGGTATAPTVVGLHGTAGIVAMHGTSILWDSSGPSLETSSGALILKTNGINKIIQLVASAGTIGSFSRSGSQSAFLTPSNVDLLVQGVGSGVIQLLAGGDLRLDSDNIYFRSNASTNKGRWTSAGLRVGDGTAPTDVIESTGNIKYDVAVASPRLFHDARTTDAATTDLTITSQEPVAGAATNKNPGNLVYKVPAAAAGGVEGKHSFWVAGTERALFGSDASNAAFLSIGANPATLGAARFPNNTGFYGRNAANSGDVLMLQLNTSDAINLGDSAAASGVNINAKTGGTIQLTINGTGYIGTTGTLSKMSTQNTGDVCAFQNSGITGIALVQLTGTQRIAALFAGNGFSATQMPANTGDFVGYGANAATNPTANPVGGGIFYWTGGALTHRGSSGTVTTMGPA